MIQIITIYIVAIVLSLIIHHLDVRKHDRCPKCGRRLHTVYDQELEQVYQECPHCGYRKPIQL